MIIRPLFILGSRQRPEKTITYVRSAKSVGDLVAAGNMRSGITTTGRGGKTAGVV